MEMEEEEKKRLRHDLVDFTLQLHLNKVLPLDYNPKNIFYRKTNGKYHFALIDINRLKLGKSARYQNVHECLQPTGYSRR